MCKDGVCDLATTELRQCGHGGLTTRTRNSIRTLHLWHGHACTLTDWLPDRR